MDRPLVTLTTDFGNADGFVGTMKGVILGICAGVSIVDITHEVPPHDIAGASFVFASALPFFPRGTIHVLVVDPGVGTARGGLVVRGADATFVCPNNGVLSNVLQAAGVRADAPSFHAAPVVLPEGWTAHLLTNDRFFRHPMSSTFHGRDVFAPVAAHLACGVAPEEMGESAGMIEALALPVAGEHGGAIEGCVVHVDRFGNLITNVSAEILSGDTASVVIEISGRRIAGLTANYQDGAALVALIGSHGGLEIAMRNGSAAKELGVTTGAPVHVSRPG